MDLKKRLDLGHSRVQTNEIVQYVDGKSTRFKKLVKIFLEGDYRTTQRAAWPLSICIETWPYLLDPHLQKLLYFLENADSHDAVKRNILRLLQFVTIPKRFHGRVTALCFDYLQDPKVAIAIRVFSMTVLSHIIKDQPDMKKELKLVLEDQLPYAS